MKTKSFLLGVVASALCMVNYSASAQHKTKAIVRNNISSLAPYEYDCYSVKEFTYGPKEQSIVVEFFVYSEEEYKLLFCKSRLPQSVDVNIYDKNPASRRKKLLYFDESGEKDQYVCNFKPTETGSYYIEYKIPAATEKNQKGSIIVMIGIKDNEEMSLAKK